MTSQMEVPWAMQKIYRGFIQRGNNSLNLRKQCTVFLLENIERQVKQFVRVFTHMVSCHHDEALNFKLKHKRANKSLSDVDRLAQWFTAEYLINQIAIKTDCGVATNKGPNICSHYRS